MTQAHRIEADSKIDTRLKSIRCPYCVEGREFKLMINRDGDGWHMCANCGHLAMAKNPDFKCPCAKCATLNVKKSPLPC